MPRISTGTGDGGDTGLVGGGRVPKTDPRVEAGGAVDELNDALGVAAAFGDDGLRGRLQAIQEELFTVGADLASPRGDGGDGGDGDGAEGDDGGMRVAAAQVERLESETARLESELPELRRFILPGGTRAAALLHLARSVCRRAERRAWALAEAEDVNRRALVYLNRLSDLLFLMAREQNVAAGVEERQWVGAGGE